MRWHSTLQQDDKDGARMFEDRDPELQWWCRMMMVNGSLHVDCLLQLVWQSQWHCFYWCGETCSTSWCLGWRWWSVEWSVNGAAMVTGWCGMTNGENGLIWGCCNDDLLVWCHQWRSSSCCGGASSIKGDDGWQRRGCDPKWCALALVDDMMYQMMDFGDVFCWMASGLEDGMVRRRCAVLWSLKVCDGCSLMMVLVRWTLLMLGGWSPSLQATLVLVWWWQHNGGSQHDPG